MYRAIAMIFALRALFAPSSPAIVVPNLATPPPEIAKVADAYGRHPQQRSAGDDATCVRSKSISVTCTNGARPIVATAGSVSEGCHGANAQSAVSREP